VAFVARSLAIVGLVILVLLLAFPLGIGMAFGMCPDCAGPGTPAALTMCATLVAALLIAGLLISGQIGGFDESIPASGVLRRLERPPRSI
jgi:hypothetical protein